MIRNVTGLTSTATSVTAMKTSTNPSVTTVLTTITTSAPEFDCLTIRCAKGRLTMTESDPDNLETSCAFFDGDKTLKCKTVLHGLHTYLLTQTKSGQNRDDSVSVECKKGQLTFSEMDPDESEANSLTFRGDNTLKCRTILYGLHTWIVNQ